MPDTNWVHKKLHQAGKLNACVPAQVNEASDPASQHLGGLSLQAVT